MKKTILAVLLLSLMVIGCGVNKEYVSQQIADAESRSDAKIKSVSDKTDANAAEVARLQGLAEQIDAKADLAINKAKGWEDYVVIWTGEVNFDYDQFQIDDVAMGILSEAGDKMEANAGSIIEIVGHTDATGSASYNYRLGVKRADATKRFLSQRFGISLWRMFVISQGQDKPRALPDENQAHARNRRVMLTVWGEQ